MPTDPHESVKEFLAEHAPPEGSSLLAAVSGGADSLTLLFVLADLRAHFGFTLHAAYLHHGMRAAADADAAMLQSLCGDLAVPLCIGRADVPRIAQNERLSLEVAGRQARYAFLHETAAKLSAWGFATGHTQDDQAETVLLRVVSGTGLEGLAGIAPARRVVPPESPAPLWLLRPLIGVPRAETQAFCAARGLTPVQDPANLDRRYPRNRVRHDLLPLLARDFNPNIRAALARLADLARAEEEVLAGCAQGAAPVQPVAGGARIPLEPWLSLPLALRRRVAREALRVAGASGRALGFENVERLLLGVRHGESGRSLAGDLRLICDATCATLTPVRPQAAPRPFDLPLDVPGTIVLPEGVLSVDVVAGNDVPEAGPWDAYLDADRLDAPLYVRSRRPGDRMRPLGLGGSRKLSDLFIDRKVPRAARDLLPVVLCGERIAWAAGVAVSEEFRVTGATRAMAHFAVRPPLFGTR